MQGRKSRFWVPCLALVAACSGTAPVQTPAGNGSGRAAGKGAKSRKTAAPGPVRLVYPESPRGETVDVVHREPVPDPYRWLEAGNSPRVQSWQRAQDQLARSYLSALPDRDALEDRLADLSYYDAISAPVQRKERFFYTRRLANKEAAILYWKHGEDGKEITLVDPNASGTGALAGWWPSPDGRSLAYMLDGEAGAVLHVLDVDSGKARDGDGMRVAEYAEPSWTADSKGFYYTVLPADPNIPAVDLPAYAHVRYHVVGRKTVDDVLVYPAVKDAAKRVEARVSQDGRYLFVTVQRGWSASDVYFKDLRAPHKRKRGRRSPRGKKSAAGLFGFATLAAGMDARFQVDAWQGFFYVRTDYRAARYRLFKVDPRHPTIKKWREIVPESRSVLHDFAIAGNHLLLMYFNNASSNMELRDVDGRKPRRVALPGRGTVEQVIAAANQDDIYYTYSSFTDLPQIFQLSVKSGQSAPWAAVAVPIDTSQMVVEQTWYPSKDGSKVSMFVIRLASARPDGKNSTIVAGQGAFGTVMSPRFSPRIAVWVERGGVYAVVNLRGGGEYGAAWHEAGAGTRKRNAIGDLLHGSDYLMELGWTTPERLGVAGRAAGGPVVGAVITQEPALFHAIVMEDPILDMIRYHRSGRGKAWIPEFGSADNGSEFAVLSGYSPYHRVKRGTAYPALLLFGGARAYEIDPMHARKFAAAMQWAQEDEQEGKEKRATPVLLRIEKGAEQGVHEQVTRDADTLAFMARHLGLN